MSQLQTGIYVWRRGSVNIGEFSLLIHLKLCVFGMQIFIFIFLLFILCFFTLVIYLQYPHLTHRGRCPTAIFARQKIFNKSIYITTCIHKTFARINYPHRLERN